MSAPASFPLSRREFEETYRRVPRLCVEVVIRQPDGVLLVQREIDPCRGQWHLPGGTVFFGESLPAAVVRVARRELGVSVTAGDMLGYLEYPSVVADGYWGWPVGIAFAATIVGGRVVGSDEGRQTGWFTDIPANTVREQADFLRPLVPSAP
ncbi:NUDIX hydrolase [Parafrankia sp. EUN1f]|uniref:NUDIX hydrolase n=1 Tax=Parafrankia sp. EUN1f TaxID=102897 RepID=UPI0001C45E6B|nr:NUDIX hydrolase [Parafrankia sp. EUN1f]EFC82768.1 NUDIX hydrolase [Parafrankia sp. EUN1f]